MSIKHGLLISIVGAFVLTPAASSAVAPMPRAQIAERMAGGQFEFRSRTQVWLFTPDGRVKANYTVSRMSIGGIGETFGLRASGAWRRDGDRLCIQWQQGSPGASGCYRLLTGKGAVIYLTGPQLFEGTLEAAQSAPKPGVAQRPVPRPRPFGR
jgi:hypothetical protein